MQENTPFKKIFGNTPILGMIHLAGEDPVSYALNEISLYIEEGVTGAIIENYHGSINDVINVLEITSKFSTPFLFGINILPNNFSRAFSLAKRYATEFIQLDYVAGKYTQGELPVTEYLIEKEKQKNIIVLGGVWPKYYTPVKESQLEKDLQEGIKRSDAIVVTGNGTGKETPIDKIKMFRSCIKEHPLVIGAGITVQNAYEQLYISDGAIIGSAFKIDNKTENAVDKIRVRDIMDVVKEVRCKKENKD